MAIGERIRFFRNMRGMTQKYLGMAVGFSERTADIRMAQYESGKRTPKKYLTESLAYVLGVSPMALDIPNIESDQNLMHTLFAIEDIYGLIPVMLNGEAYLKADVWHVYKERPHPKSQGEFALSRMLKPWAEEAEKLRRGEITQEEYDYWRYTYPEVEARRLSEALWGPRKADHPEQSE